MVRIVSMLLALVLVTAGFGFAGAHAAHLQRGPAATTVAMIADCHHDSTQHAPATTPDDFSCSVLCCALVTPGLAMVAAPTTTRLALLETPVILRSLGRAPPAPPPRA